MRQDSQKALIAGAALALALLALRFAFPAKLTDQQQIDNEIHASLDAAYQHDTGSVMQCVSRNYSDSNGLTQTSIRMYVAHYIKEAAQIDATTAAIDTKVNGAQAETNLKIAYSLDANQPSISFDHVSVTLEWKKEHVTHWLVFPADEWRVVSASYPSIVTP